MQGGARRRARRDDEHGAPEPHTLDDDRIRYALYRGDPDLQAAHAACPWLVTRDDHEVQNDYASDRSEHNHPAEWFLQRREAAYRAYYEHMPLRRQMVPSGRTCGSTTARPSGAWPTSTSSTTGSTGRTSAAPLPGSGAPAWSRTARSGSTRASACWARRRSGGSRRASPAPAPRGTSSPSRHSGRSSTRSRAPASGLAGEYGGAGRRHRTQPVQDVAARKARGCDLAFEMNTQVKIAGTIPGGGLDAGEVRVAGIELFLVMKGMAVHDPLKPRDAWDIYFCVTNYPGGLDALVREFRPHLAHSLVAEGLRKIREKFLSPIHIGPKSVADFEEVTDREAPDLRQRDAFEHMDHLLKQLGVASSDEETTRSGDR